MLYTSSNRYHGRVRRGRGLLSGAKTLGKRVIRLAKHAGRKMLGGFVDTAKKTAWLQPKTSQAACLLKF